MRISITLLMALLLMNIHFAQAQTETVAVGLSGPLGLALHNNDLYVCEYQGAKISKIDITQPFPAPVTTLLANIPQAVGVVLVGDYLYFSAEVNIPGQSTSVGRINLQDTNPVIEIITTNITSAYKSQTFLQHGNDLFISCVGDVPGIYKINLNEPFPQTAETVITNKASGMAIHGNDLYFGNFNGHSVQKFNISQPNETLTTVISDLDGPDGLTFNGNYLYISEFNGTEIKRIDINESNPVPVTVVENATQPSLVVFDGINLYYSEFGGGKVSRLTVTQSVFPTQPVVCTDAAPNDLGGASPTGGFYTGPGVTDNGNGVNFSFDPIVAGGPGTYNIAYHLSGVPNVTANVQVVQSPTITFTLPGTVMEDSGPILLNGSPAGGTYAGPGITGNNFDPALAGPGTHLMSYTYFEPHCGGTVYVEITVTSSLAGDLCAGAFDINFLFGGPQEVPQTSSLIDNTGYTATDDPGIPSGCFYLDAPLNNTIWFTFEGDGNTYRFRSVECEATNYIANGDTRSAVFTGACGNMTMVGCNDDEDINNSLLNFSMEIATQNGVIYRALVDGYNQEVGEFCLEVTNLGTTAVVDISETNITVFPNPTTGYVQLQNVSPDEILVFDNMGRLMKDVYQHGNSLDLAASPAGIYFLKIMEKGHQYSARVIKQ